MLHYKHVLDQLPGGASGNKYCHIINHPALWGSHDLLSEEQLKQLATDYSQQKHTTWAGRGRIIIAQSKANCLSCSSDLL